VQAGLEKNRHKRYALIIRQFQAATIGFSGRRIPQAAPSLLSQHIGHWKKENLEAKASL